jgi:hypothetical protein
MSLFQAPKYPEAPKDMYYQVPSKPLKIEKPKPIFPWEEHAPKPTRVFPEERAPSPEPEPEPEQEPESVTAVMTTSDASEASNVTKESRSSSTSVSEIDPWNSYTRTNAWDAVPEIERYVQAFSQSRKGKVQVVHQAAPRSDEPDQTLSSPPTEPERRPSMKLTDFPTEFERPSLPVTPAPRHPSFWGEERDEAGVLPAAEGVPKQQDWVSRVPSLSQPNSASSAPASASLRVLSWRCQYCGKQNPVQKLEELQRRQSEVLQTGPELQPKELPRRAMPGSAVDTAAVATEATENPSSPGRPTTDLSEEKVESGIDTAAVTAKATPNALSPARPKPILKEPSFELGGLGNEASSGREDVAPEVLSPDVTTSA